MYISIYLHLQRYYICICACLIEYGINICLKGVSICSFAIQQPLLKYMHTISVLYIILFDQSLYKTQERMFCSPPIFCVCSLVRTVHDVAEWPSGLLTTFGAHMQIHNYSPHFCQFNFNFGKAKEMRKYANTVRFLQVNQK